MKLFFLLLVASAAVEAEWEAAQRILLDQKIEITTLSGTRTRATFVSFVITAVTDVNETLGG
jgi:hypothetical protein